MALILDKTLTRDSTNTITIETPYLELNTKSAKIVEDMVAHVEGQIGAIEGFISDIDDAVLGHVAIAKNHRDDALEYKDLTIVARDETAQLKIDVTSAIANAGMDYPAVSRKLKAQHFGVL
ncbi:MAG: hypothetical protein WBK67_02365 [Minisyncoccales bacterium]